MTDYLDRPITRRELAEACDDGAEQLVAREDDAAADALRALAVELRREPTAAECTGMTAAWCPVHGDCSCDERADGERTMDDERCPLHGSSSAHAERPAPAALRAGNPAASTAACRHLPGVPCPVHDAKPKAHPVLPPCAVCGRTAAYVLPVTGTRVRGAKACDLAAAPPAPPLLAVQVDACHVIGASNVACSRGTNGCLSHHRPSVPSGMTVTVHGDLAPPSLAPVPRDCCGRCDRCGMAVAFCKGHHPHGLVRPRSTCAGCGAPYREEAAKVKPPGSPVCMHVDDALPGREPPLTFCGQPLSCPLHDTVSRATKLRPGADSLGVTLSAPAEVPRCSVCDEPATRKWCGTVGAIGFTDDHDRDYRCESHACNGCKPLAAAPSEPSEPPLGFREWQRQAAELRAERDATEACADGEREDRKHAEHERDTHRARAEAAEAHATRQTDYSVALQRIIEDLCHDRPPRESAKMLASHHCEMAVKWLAERERQSEAALPDAVRQWRAVPEAVRATMRTAAPHSEERQRAFEAACECLSWLASAPAAALARLALSGDALAAVLAWKRYGNHEAPDEHEAKRLTEAMCWELAATTPLDAAKTVPLIRAFVGARRSGAWADVAEAYDALMSDAAWRAFAESEGKVRT